MHSDLQRIFGLTADKEKGLCEQSPFFLASNRVTKVYLFLCPYFREPGLAAVSVGFPAAAVLVSALPSAVAPVADASNLAILELHSASDGSARPPAVVAIPLLFRGPC